MSISPLVSSVLLKGVASFASKALNRLDEAKEVSSGAKLEGQGESVRASAKEFGRLLRSYQEVLSDRIQPPYLEGAVENNQRALEEVSEALSQHLDTLDIRAERSGLMEQLGAGLSEFGFEGQGLGSPFQSGVWPLLGEGERSLLKSTYGAEQAGKSVEVSANELALRIKSKFMV